MAKKITRTISTTKVTALCVDLKKVEPFNDVIVINGSFDISDKKLEALAHKSYDSDARKLVQILSVEPEEKIYGMTEEEFMKYARELNEKRHFIDEEVSDAFESEV